MKYRLGDLFNISSGGTPSRNKPEYYEKGTIPWVKTGDLKKKYLNEGFEYITQQGLENSSAKLYKKNTVLLAMYGATIGACSILGIEASCNQACAAFSENDKVLPEYLYYFLCSRKKKFIDDSVGGAQPNISVGYLEKIYFDLIDISHQNEVVKKLSIVENIISLRNQQLEQLDLLIKSRFVEMFGDPVINEKKWETNYLVSITDKIGSGATPKGGKENYQDEGISLIRSLNVHDGRFEYKDLAHITEAQAKELDNVEIKANDVFINITGASVARSCIVPDNVLPARVNQHVSIIRCKHDIINHIFINQLFLNPTYKKHLLLIGENGATRQAITKQQLEKLLIILPPLALQNQFAAFVEEVEKEKATVKQSLEQLDILKKKLMQDYFG